MLKIKKLEIPRKYIYLLSFFIPFLTVLISLASGGFAPFGSKDIMTAGGYEGVIPYFNEFHDRLFSGSLFSYSTNSGLGYDFTTVISYYLSDPLNILLTIFPKTVLLPAIDIMYAIKIGLAGLFFSFFLFYRAKIREKTPDAFLIIAFSASYSLSSYMICYGINIIYTTAVALFPIVILGMDKIIHERKFKTYLIAMSLSIYCSFYISIITFIFSLCYLALQNYEDVDHVVKTVLRKLLADIMSFGIASVIIINSITSPLLKSELDIHFYGQGMYGKFLDVVKMMLTHSLPYQVTSESNGVSFYAGIVCIFMLIPFLFNKAIKTSYKVKNLIMTGLLFFAGMSITSNYLFNAFFLNIEYKTFFGFLMCFMLVTIAYETLINIEATKQLYIIISFAASIVTVILSMLFCTKYDSASPFITSMEFLMFFFLICLIYKQKNISEQFFNIAISLVVLIEICSGCFISFRALAQNSISYAESDTGIIELLGGALKEASPDSKIYIYDPASVTATPLSYTLCGYDYIIAKNDQDVASYLQSVVSIESYNIYKNPYSLSNGFVTDHDPSTVSYQFLKPYTSSNILVKDLFNFIPESDTSNDADYSSDSIFKIISGEVNLVVGKADDEDYLKTTLFSSGDLYSNLSYRTFSANNVKANETIYIKCIPNKLTIREPIIGGELAFLNEDNLKSLYQTVTDSNSGTYRIYNVTDKTKWASSSNVNSLSIAGEEMVYVNNSSDSISFIPIYFYIGLSISLLSILICVTAYALSIKKGYSFSKDNKVLYFVTGFANKYTDQIIIFIISGVVFILILMYTCCTPLGLKSISISDGYVQYYPLGTGYWQDYEQGNIRLLNYHLGFGMDNLILYSASVINPLNWLEYIKHIPAIKRILPSPNILSSIWGAYLSILLISQLMYLYLTKRPNAKEHKPDSLTLITATLAYTFSTYVIGYFTFFTGLAYMLPIVMLVTEKLLYEKKVVPYVIVMFFVMAIQNYTAFILCEFLALFFFITDFENVSDFFRKGFRFALSSILSAGLAAVVLVKFFLFTQSSPYQAEDAAVIANSPFKFDHTLLKSLYDFQFLHYFEPVTSDNTRANTYCGLAFLLLIALFFVNKKVKLSVRIRTSLLLFILYFAYGNSFLNYVFHGFHMQVMVPGRFAIFFIILLITTIVDTIATIDKENTKSICISLSVWYLILLSGFVILNIGHFDFSAISTIILITIYTILILVFLKKNKPKYRNALLYLTIAEVLINAYFISYFSIGQSVSHLEASIAETKTLADKYHLGDSKLTRTECINYYMSNAACILDTNSVTYFSSNSTCYQADLASQYGLETATNAVEYRQGNPLANLMLSVKYFFTSVYNDYAEVPDYYSKIDEISGITLYENTLALDPGIFVPINKDIEKKEISSLEYQNEVSNQLIAKDLYNIQKLKPVDYDTYDNQSDPEEIIVTQDIYESTYDNTSINIMVPEEYEGYTYFTFKNAIYYLGHSEKGEIKEYEMDLGLITDFDKSSKNFRIGFLNYDNYKELHDTLSGHTMTDMKYGFNDISGNISAPSDGTIFLSVPPYPTWEAYVDGNKVSWTTFLGGVGIPVTSGNHSIRMVYHTAGLKEGIIISVISLIIFIVYIVISKRIRKRTLIQKDNPILEKAVEKE